MLNKYLSLIVGVLVFGLGAGLVTSHLRTRRRHADDPSLDDGERSFFQRQFRRRMQASSLLAVVGILIPIGDDLFVDWQRHQGGWATYWMIVLLLVLWVLVLASLDWLATGVHVRNSRNALSRLERKQRELQEELERLRSRHGPDGPAPTQRNGHL
jgi:hypothetical protein